jgi:hypothetical protein
MISRKRALVLRSMTESQSACVFNGDHIWSAQIEHQRTQITRVWAWVRFYVRMINSAGVITLSGREDIKLA